MTQPTAQDEQAAQDRYTAIRVMNEWYEATPRAALSEASARALVKYIAAAIADARRTERADCIATVQALADEHAEYTIGKRGLLLAVSELKTLD